MESRPRQQWRQQQRRYNNNISCSSNNTKQQQQQRLQQEPVADDPRSSLTVWGKTRGRVGALIGWDKARCKNSFHLAGLLGPVEEVCARYEDSMPVIPPRGPEDPHRDGPANLYLGHGDTVERLKGLGGCRGPMKTQQVKVAAHRWCPLTSAFCDHSRSRIKVAALWLYSSRDLWLLEYRLPVVVLLNSEKVYAVISRLLFEITEQAVLDTSEGSSPYTDEENDFFKAMMSLGPTATEGTNSACLANKMGKELEN
ncbi:hypothetical protein GWK47_001098 [Chionoecetes opilio]|uniref:Uncharacterized protein n=1 Tax=Chionoecetes opilio TaxID=41210 RepID=A0A8J5CN69_CHIOP|nr:hypothetical protein GWK47_001098 [Chionoecetes opilio]